MNSKERVQRTLARQPVDRIPIGFFCIDFDTVEKILGHETYLRAKAKSQIAFWEGRRDEVVQSWKEDLIALYKKLDFIDIINVSAMASSLVPPKDLRARQSAQGRRQHLGGRRRARLEIFAGHRRPDPGLRPDRALHPRTVRPERHARTPFPEIFEVVDAVIAAFPDRYILGPTGGEAGMVLLGDMEQGLRLYAEDPELVQRAIDYETRMSGLRDPVVHPPRHRRRLLGAGFFCHHRPADVAAHVPPVLPALHPGTRARRQKPRPACLEARLRQQLEAAGHVRRSRL